MQNRVVHFGIDFSFRGPGVVANTSGVSYALEEGLFGQISDPWLVPVFAKNEDGAKIPGFRTVRSILGQTENIDFGGQKLRKPHFILRDVFKLLEQIAEEGFGSSVGEVVVCTAAFYPERQRSFLLESAKQAGFQNVHLIDANIASCIHHIDDLDDGLALIIHPGFENCEIALVEIENRNIHGKGYQQSVSNSTLSLSHVMQQSILGSLDPQQESDLVGQMSPAGWLQMFALSEQAVTILSLRKTHEILLSRQLTGFDDHLAVTFNNIDLRALLHTGFRDLLQTCTQFLQEKGVQEKDVKHVVLSGEGARNPYLHSLFLREFDRRLFLCDENADIYGCARWAELMTGEIDRTVAPLPAIAAPEDAPQETSPVIRGSVETVSQDKVVKLLRSMGTPSEAFSTMDILSRVREKAMSYLDVADTKACEAYLHSIEEIVVEVKAKVGQPPAHMQPAKSADAKAPKTGISDAMFLAKIKKPSEDVKNKMKQAVTIADPLTQAKILEKAVGASHDIERWAKVKKDNVKLNAVVQVHTKSARLLMQGAQWDGSDETVFILCNKWLNCAMRTINENSLSETLDELREAFYTLYAKRIPFLIAHDQKREANGWKNHYVSLFGNEDGFLAVVDKE